MALFAGRRARQRQRRRRLLGRRRLAVQAPASWQASSAPAAAGARLLGQPSAVGRVSCRVGPRARLPPPPSATSARPAVWPNVLEAHAPLHPPSTPQDPTVLVGPIARLCANCLHTLFKRVLIFLISLCLSSDPLLSLLPRSPLHSPCPFRALLSAPFHSPDATPLANGQTHLVGLDLLSRGAAHEQTLLTLMKSLIDSLHFSVLLTIHKSLSELN